MSLGIPGQVVSLEGKVAQVDFWGTRKPVRLDIRKLEPEDVADTNARYETVLNDVCEDPISIDAIAELERTEEIEVELEFATR